MRSCCLEYHELGPLETSTTLPSGVNVSRLAPRALTCRVCSTFFSGRLNTESVPSCAFATQISLPSGATSEPSEPLSMAVTIVALKTAERPPRC